MRADCEKVETRIVYDVLNTQENLASEGVLSLYAESDKNPTGTCAVLVHGGERSLVANIGWFIVFFSVITKKDLRHCGSRQPNEYLKKQ